MYALKNLVHTELLDLKGNPLSITFVYGQPDYSKREEVWQQLKNLKSLAKPNWLCIGDFNQILTRKEKFSFTQDTIVGSKLFQHVIDKFQFCDLEATRQWFTWMNNRSENDFVMERLDRAFASVEWINSYPHYALRNHPIYHFDHGPIILDFEFQHPFRKRPFRFGRMWISHPNC